MEHPIFNELKEYKLVKTKLVHLTRKVISSLRCPLTSLFNYRGFSCNKDYGRKTVIQVNCARTQFHAKPALHNFRQVGFCIYASDGEGIQKMGDGMSEDGVF